MIPVFDRCEHLCEARTFTDENHLSFFLFGDIFGDEEAACSAHFFVPSLADLTPPNSSALLRRTGDISELLRRIVSFRRLP